jgi:hypothetical protein
MERLGRSLSYFVALVKGHNIRGTQYSTLVGTVFDILAPTSSLGTRETQAE